jgi:2-phosphoglycerate kinase
MNHLHRLFFNAYILGGSPCSGKSTVAEMLAAEYNLPYYKADDYETEHFRRSQPDRQPTMFRYSNLSWDQIWSQAPEKLFADEIIYYRERFPFVLDDLQKLKIEQPVILEGAAFLPEFIKQYPVQKENVLFMIPTWEFQIQHYSQRPWIQSILKECRDPQQAFDNWMKRDHLFGQELIRQANALNFPVIVVDGTVDIQDQLKRIKAQFRLGDPL